MTNKEKYNSKLQTTLNQWINIRDKELAISEDLRNHSEVIKANTMIEKIQRMMK